MIDFSKKECVPLEAMKRTNRNYTFDWDQVLDGKQHGLCGGDLEDDDYPISDQSAVMTAIREAAKRRGQDVGMKVVVNGRVKINGEERLISGIAGSGIIVQALSEPNKEKGEFYMRVKTAYNLMGRLRRLSEADKDNAKKREEYQASKDAHEALQQEYNESF